MNYISTRGKAPAVRASDAILQGLAPDGGLYLPESIPKLTLGTADMQDGYAAFATKLLTPFFEDDPLLPELGNVCKGAFDFPVPLRWLQNHSGGCEQNGSLQAELELFHGPTIAFKDFGARFLAGSLERIVRHQGKEITILVATSGDTGGAVASAFHNKQGIAVKVLFPLGKVSARQQQQLCCWDNNITTYGVHGTFDDCQRVVKEAFGKPKLCQQWGLTSANSINLGRLLPQIVYHYYAALLFADRSAAVAGSAKQRSVAGQTTTVWQRAVPSGQATTTGQLPTYIVPSGNVGNVTGAYIAKAMGAPIGDIVLAVNANKTIPDFLVSGTYEPRPSVHTLANAMDVGDPSNMERLRVLFPTHQERVSAMASYSVSDTQILETIERVYKQCDVPICPHTATGEWVRQNHYANKPSIVVSTAHPGKFESVVEPVIGRKLTVPAQLQELLDLPASMIEINPSVEELFA